jgi:oligoendopeptidase F
MTQNGYVQERWNLGKLFTALDAPEVQQAHAQVEEQLKQFETLRPSLSPEMEPAAFVKAIDQLAQLTETMTRLGAYVQLVYTEDTQNQEVQTAVARIQQLGAEVRNRSLFFELWWKSLDEVAAERLMADTGDYQYWLEALRLEEPYTLSEAEEKIINLKNVNGPAALVMLYQSITNRYVFKLEVDGEVKEMNREELSIHFRNPDPAMRAAAYQELFRVYQEDEPTLGQIYQFLVRNWRSEYVDLRGFASPLSVRNLANDVPDEVVNTLLDVCRDNAPLFHRYFRLKAECLGVDKLRRYDIYAPLVGTEKQYPFEQGIELVLQSFHDFSPQVATLARRVFDEHHLDSEVRRGKMSGAFCAGVIPSITPWVLQTYQGRPRDVATMAHELGHAIHYMLSAEHSILTYQPSLPLAETASTFSEMLLVDRLLAQEPDPDVQRDVLFQQMDNAYGTILRQAFFALFERDAHELVHQGGSVEALTKLYAENLRTQFGDSVEVSDDFAYEWVAIPHIYRVPFYVYAYTFGQLLVLSLYQQYRREGEAFIPRYLQILSAAGSDSPARILEKAGIDIHSAAFWQGGFDVVAELMERLDAVV